MKSCTDVSFVQSHLVAIFLFDEPLMLQLTTLLPPRQHCNMFCSSPPLREIEIPGRDCLYSSAVLLSLASWLVRYCPIGAGLFSLHQNPKIFNRLRRTLKELNGTTSKYNDVSLTWQRSDRG